ncbi:glycosyltransferase [Mucilaginibacter antarcticus]|uniref:glycosyltransferase n=1 Tax=Mucilaginibacter antarcticus TaxID=1855725 RepID=UPI00363BB695
MTKVSVCLASYNGEKYIVEQLKSILSQLNSNAELIISDDGSSDETLNLVNSFQDDRIKVYQNVSKNLIKNFENAIRKATGDVIFLSDQDDIWVADKVVKMMAFIDQGYDIVVSDCKIINSEYETVVPSYFRAIDSRKGFLGI